MIIKKSALRTYAILGLSAVFFLFPENLLAQQGNTELTINIRNGTFNRPGKADRIRLLSIGERMHTLGSGKDVQDKITFKNLVVGSRYLLQVHYQGIQYFKLLNNLNFEPGSSNRFRPVNVTVFEKSSKRARLHFSLDHVVIEKEKDHFVVRQIIRMKNQTFLKAGQPVAVQPKNGFIVNAPNVPENDINVSLMYDGLPEHLQSNRKKNGDYIIRNALKPGDYQIRISYRLKKNSFELKFPFAVKHGHIFVIPIDLDIKFSEKKNFGKESENPKENYTQYQINNLPKNKSVLVELSGGTVEDINHSMMEGKKTSGKVIEANPLGASIIIIFIFIISSMMIFWIWYLHKSIPDNGKSTGEIIRKLAELQLQLERGELARDVYDKQYSYWKDSAVQKILGEEDEVDL